MDISGPIPFFVFAHVSRKPKSTDEGIKLQVVQRQLSRIRSRALASGRSLGQHFMMTTTYRQKAFLDYAVFDEAVAFARKNGTALLVGDLAELLRGVPVEQFRRCSDRLDSLEVDVWDAATGRFWRDFEQATRQTIHGMAIDRYRRGEKIAVGRKKMQGSVGNIARNQALGARANKVRAKRLAERIRPIVDEMRAALPAGERLSPSALMHRLNELGFKGPQADKWSLNAAKRYLLILDK
jgi:hypothetical protein